MHISIICLQAWFALKPDAETGLCAYKPGFYPRLYGIQCKQVLFAVIVPLPVRQALCNLRTPTNSLSLGIQSSTICKYSHTYSSLKSGVPTKVSRVTVVMLQRIISLNQSIQATVRIALVILYSSTEYWNVNPIIGISFVYINKFDGCAYRASQEQGVVQLPGQELPFRFRGTPPPHDQASDAAPKRFV